jgi:hypothetical protein
LKSGDNLFTKKVVLVDSYAVAGDSLLANGINRTYASSNGLLTDIALTPILPQPRIFTQYAAMFEFYQVDRIHTRFIPANYVMSAATVGTALAFAQPTYSIIDPDAASPETMSGFLSYGNCQVTKPYAENSRTVDYMNLGL